MTAAWARPDTELEIVHTANNKPTGRILCLECYSSGMGLGDIAHDPGCPNRETEEEGDV